jgi:hypothetical protein
MQLIPLDAVPNQAFSVRLDGALYALQIKEARGVMVIDIARDGVDLVRGLMMKGETPLLPYRHMEEGNLVLTTDGELEPFWDQFGVSQTLTYLTLAEVEELRNGG